MTSVRNWILELLISESLPYQLGHEILRYYMKQYIKQEKNCLCFIFVAVIQLHDHKAQAKREKNNH